MKDYDRDILQDLWKVRTSIHHIRDNHKQGRSLESKYLEGGGDRSTSPSPCHTPDLIKDVSFTDTLSSKAGSVQAPLHLTSDYHPSPPPPPPSSSPPSSSLVDTDKDQTSTVNDHKATNSSSGGDEGGAEYKSSDDNILEEFFGSTEFDRLNQLKLGLDFENVEGEASTTRDKSDQSASPSSISLGSTSISSSVVGTSSQLLQSHTNSEPSSQINGIEVDVVSEMQKLRLKLQESTIAELAELDRQFAPKYDLNADGNHSRQGSLDSSIPPAVSAQAVQSGRGHTRQYSLPIDPSTLPKSRVTPQPIPPQNYQLATGHHHHHNATTAPPQQPARSPLSFLNRATTYESSSLDRRSSSKSRSPTPPYLYAHVRQGSGGSGSSGSGTFSPPPLGPSVNAMSNYQYHPPSQANPAAGSSSSSYQQAPGSPTSPKSFNTPPPIRVSPSVNQPQYYSFRQSRSGSEPPQPPQQYKILGRMHSTEGAAPGNQSSAGAAHHRLPPRPSSGKVTGMSRVRNMVQQGGQVLPDTIQVSAAGGGGGGGGGGRVQGRPQSARTHYSTQVVKKKHSPEVKPTDNPQQLFHMRNGYPTATVGPAMYDRLQPGTSSSNNSTDFDQPELKSVVRGGYQKPYIKPKLEPRVSAPLRQNSSGNNSVPVHPEGEIQPYMTSGELAAQFKYTPFTENRFRTGSVGVGGPQTSARHVKQNSLPEQTWC